MLTRKSGTRLLHKPSHSGNSPGIRCPATKVRCDLDKHVTFVLSLEYAGAFACHTRQPVTVITVCLLCNFWQEGPDDTKRGVVLLFLWPSWLVPHQCKVVSFLAIAIPPYKGGDGTAQAKLHAKPPVRWSGSRHVVFHRG